MKKLFLVFSLVFLVFVVAACKKDETTTKPKTKTEETTEQQLLPGYVKATHENVNLKFAPTEVRNKFFQAAELYLLETMHGGIPTFSNSGYQMYHESIVPYSDEYVPVMGFGTEFSDVKAGLDDSTRGEGGNPIVFATGGIGQEGDKTYRSTLAQNPTTFQQWLYDDSTSSDVITLFLDAPYVFRFNQDSSGYTLVPGMTTDFPYAMVDGNAVKPDLDDEGQLLEGKEQTIAKTWRIDIRDDLQWTYHPDTIKQFPDLADTPEITAEDFVETYKMAIEEGWFRAISGGGDFFSSSQKIVNAEKFYEGKADWADVGIKHIDATDGNSGSIEFTFENDMSEWNVRYWLGSFVMGPIDRDLYDALEPANESEVNPYGTTVAYTAYNGPFRLDTYQPDKLVSYVKNPNYSRKDDYKFTHWNYAVIEDAEVRWQEFLDGHLDAASVPSTAYEAYQEDPRIKFVPGTTTFRIMINGLGTDEAQKAMFPDSNWSPDPLLANHNFKRAMYFAIDREKLAHEVMKTSTPQMYHFTDAYLVDALTGIPFRNSPEADKEIYDEVGLSTDTHGYSLDAAKQWWKAAVDELFAKGVYKSGDVVEIDFRVFSGSQAQTDFGDFIKQTFEETFTAANANHNLSVKVTVTPTAFPDIYYDYMMGGNFDLSVGGISGSSLDAASFLDVYCDDDRGGFTLNWGIDTTSANIPIEYTFEGELRKEYWSFNAITAALNGTVTVVDGEEVLKPTISLDKDEFKALNAKTSTITIPTKGSLDLTKVTASDPRDGNITDKITTKIEKYNLVDDKYDSATAISYDAEGRYKVTYAVENTNNVEESKVIYVNVKKSVPTFEFGKSYANIFADVAEANKYHIYVASRYSVDFVGIDLLDLKASDLKDGDVTSSIALGEGMEDYAEIILGKDEDERAFDITKDIVEVDLNVAENTDYTLQFKVTNSDKVTTTVTIVVHVIQEFPALEIEFDIKEGQNEGYIFNEVSDNVYSVDVKAGAEDFDAKFVKAIGEETELVLDKTEAGYTQKDAFEETLYKLANKDYTNDIEITYSPGYNLTTAGETHVVTYKVTNIYGQETIMYLLVNVVVAP